MAFLTFDDLRQLSRGLDESGIIKFAKGAPQGKTVFLSHSSKDGAYIAGAIKFFERFNASVYVDEADNTLPSKPSPATANTLRTWIQACKRFVIMASDNSRDSRWIPWELGLADGTKGVAQVALLPIGPTDTEQYWAELEYLGLYPRILLRQFKGDAGPLWRVYDPRDRKCWHLVDWLHKDIA